MIRVTTMRWCWRIRIRVGCFQVRATIDISWVLGISVEIAWIIGINVVVLLILIPRSNFLTLLLQFFIALLLVDGVVIDVFCRVLRHSSNHRILLLLLDGIEWLLWFWDLVGLILLLHLLHWIFTGNLNIGNIVLVVIERSERCFEIHIAFRSVLDGSRKRHFCFQGSTRSSLFVIWVHLCCHWCHHFINLVRFIFTRRQLTEAQELVSFDFLEREHRIKLNLLVLLLLLLLLFFSGGDAVFSILILFFWRRSKEIKMGHDFWRLAEIFNYSTNRSLIY